MNPITSSIILIDIMALNGLHFYGISAYAFINARDLGKFSNGLDDGL